MKVEVTTETLRDYRERLSINVNDKLMFNFWDGEPEDSSLARDFNDCYKIEDVIRIAYDAGRANEKLEIVNKIIEE